MKILCHGNLIFDYVYRLDPAVICANKWRADFSQVFVGGQSLNAARTLAHLGHQVFFCGTLGLPADDLEKDSRLETIIVDFSLASRIKGGWQEARVFVERFTGERFIYMSGGTSAPVSSGLLERLVAQEFDAVYLDGYHRESAIIIAEAASARVPILADLEFVDEYTAQYLASCTIALASAEAARNFTSEVEVNSVLSAIAGEQEMVALLEGAKPIEVHIKGGGRLTLPTSPTEPYDTTGAGDNFRAALLHANLSGLDIEAQFAFAARVASESCMYEGPEIPGDRLRAIANTFGV